MSDMIDQMCEFGYLDKFVSFKFISESTVQDGIGKKISFF